MLKHLPVAIFFCSLALASFILGRFVPLSPLIWLFYATAWSIVLFCGCYFIGLRYFLPSVCGVDTSEKVVALTFDDGPAAATPALLDILKEKKAEAMFFCIGRHISGREPVLKRIIAEGHIIGNHSFSHHPLFDLFSSSKMRGDVAAMSSATKAVTGLYPLLFRPPFGVTNPTVAKIVKGSYTSVGWNLRTYDTMKKTPAQLNKKILSSLKPGTIILMHDTASVTLEALPAIIDDIRKAGYRLVRLDKMCNLTPYA